MAGNWTISVAQLPVETRVGGVTITSPYVHNIIIIRDGNGNRYAEINGGPLDANGQLQDIRNPTAYIPGVSTVGGAVTIGQRFWREGLRESDPLFSGSQDEVMAYVAAARNALDQINTARDTYWLFAQNSDSVATTILQVFGIALPQNFAVNAPGSEQSLLTVQQMNDSRQPAGLPAFQEGNDVSPYGFRNTVETEVTLPDGTLETTDILSAAANSPPLDPDQVERTVIDWSPSGAWQESGFNNTGQLIEHVTADSNGNLSSDRYNSDNSHTTSNYDTSGNLLSESGTNASGRTWSESLNGDNSTFTFDGQRFSGSQLVSSTGFVLGSTIGGILGGNSLAGRIAGSTVLGTLGQSVGSILGSSGLSTALLGNGSLNASLFDSAVSTTVANFGGNLGVNAVGDIAGTFSSLLFGEAAQALGLHGFAGGLFTTIGTSITSQLAMNLGSMTLNAIGLTNNFVAGSFIGNIGGAIGGYFGSYLAAQIVPATGIASSIGGRIGGAIGGFLASEIPVVGTFFGSLVGSVMGTLVGRLFDPHIVPWSIEMIGAVNGVLGVNYWNWNGGGNPQEFTDLSNMVANNANQVLALTRRDPDIMNIVGLTSLNELVFNQLGTTLTAIYPDGNSTPFYVAGMPQAFALQALYNTSEIATYELVQHAVLVGSDPVVTGALAAARVQDTTTPAIYADLRVAQDYERYRANAEAINTAMAANPQSDFTAGWNLTLMRAQALGLDRIVTHAGWTADLTDSHETIHDANGNVVQQLQFNADGSVTTDTATVVFDFNFVDAHLSYRLDSRTYLTGPDGTAHDVTGATRLFFNDGHIDEPDGNPLVDDLYYDRAGARTFPRRRLQASAQRLRLRGRGQQLTVAVRPYSGRVPLFAVKSACG